MTQVFIAIGVYIIVLNIFRIYRLRISANYMHNYDLKKESVLELKSDVPFFYIVIPVYNESVIIQQTIQHMLRFKYPASNFRIIIVGSRDEDTIDFLHSTHKIYPKNVIFLKSEKSGKSNQLNYALNYIENSLPNDNSYFLAYDADSSPDLNSLSCIEQSIMDNNWPIALQESTLYVKNYNHLGWYARIESIYQVHRVLVYEIFGQLRSKQSTTYTYMVGHGMVIKLDFLTHIHGFSVPFDDVHMGQKLRLLGIPIVPVQSLDVADTAISFKEVVRQSGGWLLGGIIHSELKKIISSGQDDMLQKYWPIIYIKGVFDTLSWFTDGFIVLVIMILSMHEWYFLFLLLVWVILSVLNLLLAFHFIKSEKKDITLRCSDALVMVVAPLFRPLVRMLSIFSAIKVIMDGKVKRAERGRAHE